MATEIGTFWAARFLGAAFKVRGQTIKVVGTYGPTNQLLKTFEPQYWVEIHDPETGTTQTMQRLTEKTLERFEALNYRIKPR